MDLVPARITEKRPFYVWPKSVFLAKNLFFPKKHPKFAKRLIFLCKKGSFLLSQLCPVVARTLLESRSESFVSGPKIQTLAQKFGFLPKNPSFCYRISDFCDGPFVDPWQDGPFATFGSIFRLFVSEKPADAPKYLPPPHFGAPSASNSPSARAGQFHAYFRRKMLPESRHISRRQKMSL